MTEPVVIPLWLLLLLVLVVLGVLVAFVGVAAFQAAAYVETYYMHPLFLGVSTASILGATAL